MAAKLGDTAGSLETQRTLNGSNFLTNPWFSWRWLLECCWVSGLAALVWNGKRARTFLCFYHVSHPEYAQIHVFWVHDAIKSSHPLLPSAHFAFNLSLHQGLFQWGGASHQVAKVLELQHQTLWVAVICWLHDINIDGTVPIFQEFKTCS